MLYWVRIVLYWFGILWYRGAIYGRAKHQRFALALRAEVISDGERLGVCSDAVSA
jgi:hypothetical protein